MPLLQPWRMWLPVERWWVMGMVVLPRSRTHYQHWQLLQKWTKSGMMLLLWVSFSRPKECQHLHICTEKIFENVDYCILLTCLARVTADDCPGIWIDSFINCVQVEHMMEETKYSHLAGEQTGGVGVMAGDDHQDAASTSMQPAVIANMHMEVSHFLHAFPHFLTSLHKSYYQWNFSFIPFPTCTVQYNISSLLPH